MILSLSWSCVILFFRSHAESPFQVCDLGSVRAGDRTKVRRVDSVMVKCRARQRPCSACARPGQERTVNHTVTGPVDEPDADVAVHPRLHATGCRPDGLLLTFTFSFVTFSTLWSGLVDGSDAAHAVQSRFYFIGYTPDGLLLAGSTVFSSCLVLH